MNFKIGDSVRVKKGVKIPEMDCDLSFWQGRISEINDNNIVCIDLDSKTLNNLPAEDIKNPRGKATHGITFISLGLRLKPSPLGEQIYLR